MSSDDQQSQFPDPDGQPCKKYWDKNNWTKQTQSLVIKTCHTMNTTLENCHFAVALNNGSIVFHGKVNESFKY